MAIRSVETWILRFPSNRASRERVDEMFELIGVTVTNDNGDQGQGWTYTSDYGGGEAVKALLDVVLVPTIIGRDPNDVEVIARDLRILTHRLGDGIASMAISAIDIALWDLKGIQLGLSLSRMLGRMRDRVPSYGSGKASPTLPKEELISLSASYVEDGFKAIKLRVGREPGKDLDRVASVRKEIGADIKIMCDANERLDISTAIWLGERLAESDIYWFEEPVLSSDVASYARLRSTIPMAVAVGEHVFSLQAFVPYVDASAADILQPDVCISGGISEVMKIGRLAEAHGLGLAPHFMTELHVHVAAALPRMTYVEYYPFMDDLLTEPLVVDNGDILVPDVPGHGVRFNEGAWRDYRVA